MFDVLYKVSDVIIGIWFFISLPAIIRLALELAAHGWREWKQIFQGKRP